jgi:long-chain acyl-CoA synthetase
MQTVLDLFDDAVQRYGDRPAVSLRHDDASTTTWSYLELQRRSRIAAWRLRAAELEPGDRVLTWSPSTPELPAAYFGAMRARLIYVPLDLRMAPDAIERIAKASGAKRLLLGTGRDAPDPREAGLESFPTILVDALSADPDESFPPDWEAQVKAWPAPAPGDVFDLIYTSGTTGAPKGVMLAHENVVASVETFHRIVPRLEHRLVSLLPLSHQLEQSVGLFYALSVGADIVYVRSRNPRVVFDAIKSHRTTSMIVVPQVLDLFWSAVEREVDRAGRRASFDRLRSIARHLPLGARRWLFRQVHAGFGGGLRLFISSGAFLPPALQQAWEDLGVTVLQGYGSTETGSGTCTTLEDHGLGTVGRPPWPVELRLAEDGEVLFRGPTLFRGYWNDPAATAAAIDPDGWYHTGDIGRLDAEGRLILMGRKKDIIVLPNGFNVYPEDIENALRMAGIRDSVVLETRPGRIEAIVLAPRGAVGASASTTGTPSTADESDAAAGADGAAATDRIREGVGAMIKAANAGLGPQQRVAGWRIWPDEDFPRTHTLKIKRDQVRAWAAVDQPLPTHQGA